MKNPCSLNMEQTLNEENILFAIYKYNSEYFISKILEHSCSGTHSADVDLYYGDGMFGRIPSRYWLVKLF
jgi:hypothetical protein